MQRNLSYYFLGAIKNETNGTKLFSIAICSPCGSTHKFKTTNARLFHLARQSRTNLLNFFSLVYRGRKISYKVNFLCNEHRICFSSANGIQMKMVVECKQSENITLIKTDNGTKSS